MGSWHAVLEHRTAREELVSALFSVASWRDPWLVWVGAGVLLVLRTLVVGGARLPRVGQLSRH